MKNSHKGYTQNSQNDLPTFYASPQRADKNELQVDINFITNNPIVTGLLSSTGGILAVLNEHRQILALNGSFLKFLGIGDPASVLGLRPGEAVQCQHANEMPAGCGTSRFCATCGAAIALVSSLETNKPEERMCILSAKENDRNVDLALWVRSHPIEMNAKKYLLLFLQDISQQQQRAALERTFFHDINNMLGMLLNASELLLEEYPSELSQAIHKVSTRMVREVDIQRCLSQTEHALYQPMWHEINTVQIIEELRSFFSIHPAAHDKKVTIPSQPPNVSIKTDFSLLMRIVCNMIINALESSEAGEEIKFWIEVQEKSVVFCVWNAQEITQDTASRIFQRNFSTKNQQGRGIGTFSMKLFGENILGGKVSFKTSATEGTTFQIEVPL